MGCLSFIWFVYALLLSHGTFNLIGPDRFSRTFDSLGESLLEGRADIPKDVIDFEAFEVGGKTYTYMGPWPALVRIPLNYLFPENFGQWSRFCCILGLMLAVFCFARCGTEAFRGRRQPTVAVRGILLMLFGLGSPLLYLAASARVYHEAIAWGLGFTAFVLWRSLRALRTHAIGGMDLCAVSCAAACALLTRVTFGMTTVLLTLFTAWLHARSAREGSRLARTFLLVTPLIGAGIFHAWYNQARFGSIFLLADFSGNYLDPRSFGGTWNLQRLPTGIVNYLLFLPGAIDSAFPFVHLTKVEWFVPNLYFPWREEVTPLLISSPLFVMLGVAGLCTPGKTRTELMSIAALLPQAVFILGFYFLTERYISELLPLLVLGFYFALRRTNAELPGLAVTTAWSVFATMAVTIEWIAHYSFPPHEVSYEWKAAARTFLAQEVPQPDIEPPVAEIQSPRGRGVMPDGAPIYVHGARRDSAYGLARGESLRVSLPRGSFLVQARVGLGDIYELEDCHMLRATEVRFSMRAGDSAVAESRVLRPVGTRVASPGGRRDTDTLVARVRGPREVTVRLEGLGYAETCDQGAVELWVIQLP